MLKITILTLHNSSNLFLPPEILNSFSINKAARITQSPKICRSEVTWPERNERKRGGRLRGFSRRVEQELFQLDFRLGHTLHLPPPSSPSVKNVASGLRIGPRAGRSSSSSDPPFDREPSKICKST